MMNIFGILNVSKNHLYGYKQSVKIIVEKKIFRLFDYTEILEMGVKLKQHGT